MAHIAYSSMLHSAQCLPYVITIESVTSRIEFAVGKDSFHQRTSKLNLRSLILRSRSTTGQTEKTYHSSKLGQAIDEASQLRSGSGFG